MSNEYLDFQTWLRDELEWPTANSGRLGDYCIALNKAQQKIIVVKIQTDSSEKFKIEQEQTFDSHTEAMNTYRKLCSLDITINQFLNDDS